MVAEKYIRQAANRIADRREAAGYPESAKYYRNGDYDHTREVIAFAEYIEQHDKPQPTFEQRVEAMRRTYQTCHATYEAAVEAYDRHLAEIMAPKPDPLVEAMDELEWCNTDALASDLRKALAARGLEIREAQG